MTKAELIKALEMVADDAAVLIELPEGTEHVDHIEIGKDADGWKYVVVTSARKREK